MQNRILRIIGSDPLNDVVHCADIRKKLSILNVSDQIKLQISSLMWDFDHKSLPSELAIKFAKISSVHNYQARAASHGSLYCKKVRTIMESNHSVTKVQKFIMNWLKRIISNFPSLKSHSSTNSNVNCSLLLTINSQLLLKDL